MKDTTSTMADNMPPPPFKLERESTLMPSEFLERLSASTRSRKSSAARSAASSAARSAARRSRNDRHSASVRVSRQPMDHVNSRFTYENDYEKMLHHSNSVSYYNQHFGDDNTELNSSSRFYDANLQMASIGEQENIYRDTERTYPQDPYLINTSPRNMNYSIATPPTSMSIRDLMEPLEDWNAKDSIKEKKYAVLPSIGKTPSPTKPDATSHNSNNSGLSNYSYSNQLDYGRDRMEQEADFFADFRINTSEVHATPRQNPLPPIESIKMSQSGVFPKEDNSYLQQLNAMKQSYKNNNFQGIDSLNARQMSGKQKKKPFKYL